MMIGCWALGVWDEVGVYGAVVEGARGGGGLPQSQRSPTEVSCAGACTPSPPRPGRPQAFA